MKTASQSLAWAFGTFLLGWAASRAVAQAVILTNLATPNTGALCAVNPGLNKIYYAGGTGNAIDVIDGATFSQTSAGVGEAVDVDLTNNNYWSVAVGQTATVWNGANTQLQNVSLGSFCAVAVSVDSPHRVVWVGDQCGGGNDPVWAINADTFSIINEPIGSGGVQGPILVNPANGRLYIFPSSVSKRVNPATFAVTANTFGQVVGVNVPLNLLYARTSSTTLQIINGAPDPEVVLTNITLPFSFNGSQIGVNPTLNRIYVGNAGSSNIAVLNATTGQSLGSISLGTGVTSVGTIIVDASRNRVYAAAISGGGNHVFVVQDSPVQVSLICGNDPLLLSPGFLTSDGTNLFVSGVGTGSSQHIYRVPASGGSASILYSALNPEQIAWTGTNLFWIDPNAGPIGDTEILKSLTNGSGGVTPIYIGENVGQPIVDGSGMAADGKLLYAADEVSGSVWRLNFDGTGLMQIGGNRYASGFSTEHLNTIAVNQGVLYLADSGQNGGTPQILSIATNGASFATLASGAPLVRPSGIAVGNGMIYVADPGAANTIWQLPMAGGTPTALVSGATFHGILGLTFANGVLYVCDYSGGAIYAINPSASPTLSLTASTAGGGSILVSPPGPYLSNTVVTLTATASNNWSFLGWTGSAATNASTFTLTVNGSLTEQAVFGTTLDVQQLTGGTVGVSPVQSLYPYGSTVVLTATPQSSNYFQAWLADASAGGVTSPYSLVVTTGAPKIEAKFAPIQTGQLSLICGNDPHLLNPAFLASDGVNLFVTGSGPGTNQDIFRVPVGGGAASIIYSALNPNEIALAGANLFWIDPNAGPVGDTEILKALNNGSGNVTPIYVGENVGQPIVDGSGLASDGSALYAADEVDGTVWRLNPDGSGLAQIGPARYSGYFSTEHLNTIAVSQGVLYLADSGQNGGTPQVVSIATNGSSFTTVALGAPFVRPSGIAVGNGMIYVSDPGASNTIWQIPITGGTPTAFVSGLPFHLIQGLTFVNGTLYVCDDAGGAIYAVTTSAATGLNLNATTAGGGSVMVSPPGPYTNNTVVTLTATPSNHWSFIGWTGNVATNASTFTLTMNSNQTEQAIFGTSLNVQQEPGGTVGVSPVQSLYPFGSTVVLTATPQSSNFFQTWLADASPGGSTSPYNFAVTIGAPTLEASFAPNPTASVITNVAAPTGLSLCAVNPVLNKIYFASGNPAAEQMVVVDGSTFAQIGIGTGDDVDVDMANNNYWSVGVYSGTATVWNFNNTSLGNVSLGYCPVNVSVDAPRRTVWVGAQCGPGNDPLWAINADTHAIIAGPISSGGVQGSILVNPATGRLYINPNGVSRRVNPAASYAVTANAFGRVIAVNAAENLLYAQSSSTTLQIINGAPDPEVVLTSVTLPFSFSSTFIGVNPSLNRLYIGNNGSNNVAILDATTGQNVGGISLGAGVTSVGAIIVDSTRNRLYAVAVSGGAARLYVLQDEISANPIYTVTASTAGGGSVALSPPTGPYTNGTVVTFTATPSNNWNFIGWTGSVTTNAGTFNLTVTSNLSGQAVFGTALTVEQTVGGAVQTSPSQSLYAFGSSVLLTAVPVAGDYFQSWLAAASPGGTNSPYNFVVTNGAPTVGAQFAVLPTTMFTLTAEVNGGGTATPSPQATLYTNGTSIAVTATPMSGQFFVNWSGDGNGSTANPLLVVMKTNKTVIANFVTPSPPGVALTSPTPGASLAWPANLSLSADVSTLFGAVTNVAFFADNTQIGAATQPPFNFTWTNAAVGTHGLTALATASTGLSAMSAPISVTLTNQTGSFAFANASYSVHESNGMVALNIISTVPGGGLVPFETTGGNAVPGGPNGNNSSGDYISTRSFAVFSGAGTQTIRIPITDNFNVGPPVQFQVTLLSPNGGTLGNPATATVTIMRDDIGNGLLTPQLPTNQPPMTGQLTVFLPPAQAGGQWRFPWESAWRASGATASNLVAGDYPVVFSKVPGYLAIPLASDPLVTNGMTTFVTNTYLPTPLGTLGSLTVTTQPAGGTATGWQFVGETTWRPSGFTAANLVSDTYQVAFQPISGYATPPSVAVLVTNFGVQLTGGSYAPSVPVSGVVLPAPVDNTQITNYPNPYAYTGQLQTAVGFGSGVAVTANVVLTAAHLVFDDYSLAFVPNAYWSFQEAAGEFQPEPQAARGIYVLSGYAAQRTNDLLVGGYSPDQSSALSRDLDVAALYFPSPMARTGYAGYLSANVVPNPYLESSSVSKVLTGYPVDGSQFGNDVAPGQLYATPGATNAFTQANDQVYTASWFYSYPGNSGGPIMVEASGDQYFPAAIYLGTLFSGGVPTASVVRAIDSSVTNLITLASLEGDAGTNNSGGGVIPLFTIAAAGVTASHPGFLILQIGPPSALQAGAAWKITNQPASYYSTASSSVQAITNTNALVLQFQTIPGWNPPTNRNVTLNADQTVTVAANYTVTNPVLTFGSGNTLGLSGTLNTSYQIQSNSTLNYGTWVTFKTNLLAPGFNLITNHPRPGFYRALWLGN